MMKQSLEKQLTKKQEYSPSKDYPDLTRDNLANRLSESGSNQEILVVEVATSKGTTRVAPRREPPRPHPLINQTDGTNKNRLRVLGRSNPKVGQTSDGTL